MVKSGVARGQTSDGSKRSVQGGGKMAYAAPVPDEADCSTTLDATLER